MNFFQKLILIFIICLFAFKIQAQENQSIHQQEWQAHRHLPAAVSFFNPSGSDIIPLKLTNSAQPIKTIFGYLPDWEYKNAREYLQYDVLTHIGAFDFVVDANGNVGNPRYWPWTDVINQAHANGVKVILVAVNFTRDQIRNILTSETARSNFFIQVRNKIKTYKLDGVNVDFESLYSADRGALLNNFMSELTDYIHTEIPGAEVSFAGPAVNWGGWNLAGLAEACDYIFIMGYAFYGSWSSASGPQAPLTGGNYNITNTVTVQYAEVTNNHPEKLILGLPYYGGRWQTVSGQAYASVNDFKNSPRFRTATHESPNYGPVWDGRSQTPWYAYKIGTDWYQVWCDNAVSLGLKYDLAQEKNYRGVGMWALGYDSGRSELWNELRRRYVPSTLPVPDQPKGIYIRPSGADFLPISIAGQDFTDGFFIYYGSDGLNFSDSVYSVKNENIIRNLKTDSLYFIRLRAKNGRALSPVSSVLSATCTANGADVLIVDGFDRNVNRDNNSEYIRRHALAFRQLGYSVASSTNEAVINGELNLQDYKYCDWLLGEESTADFTFNVFEKELVKEYLESGGNLFVSGSEIGWDLVEEQASAGDIYFYENVLKAAYVDDAPLGRKATYYQVEGIAGGVFDGIAPFYFDDGNYGTYNVDWPDAISANNGSELSLKYAGINTVNGGCAINYEGAFAEDAVPAKLVYLSFPFETIYPEAARNEVLEKIMLFFDKPVAINETFIKPLSWRLEQNYPNPFNSKTMISYHVETRHCLVSTESSVHVELTVYNALGQKVRTLVDRKQETGNYSVTLNAAGLSSGIYYYRLNVGDFSQVRKMILLK